MIITPGWMPPAQAGIDRKTTQSASGFSASGQNSSPDFLAEMIKLTAASSAIESFGDQTGTGESPMGQMRQLLEMSNILPEKNLSGNNRNAQFGGNGGEHMIPYMEAINSLGVGGPASPKTMDAPDSPAALFAMLQTALNSPAAEQAAPAAASSLRRAISAYTPHYSAQGFRQKIDFSAQRDALGSRDPVTEATRPAQDHPAYASQPITTIQGEGPDQQTALGGLTARFESMHRPDAIGYDRRGGTCYGTYQLSSRRGGLEEFLKFLDREAPEWAGNLRAAGPGNTGGRTGGMPSAWREIHAQSPERFAALQHDFTRQAYYDPAANAVQRQTGMNPENASPALREVLWSTAVQHGVQGAAGIFQRALDAASSGRGDVSERELIQAVYSERASRFPGSSPAVRAAVENRFQEEMQIALNQLGKDQTILI